MRHPRRALLFAVPLLALAACGDDSPAPEAAATLQPAESVPPTTPPTPSTPTNSYEVPTGADEVVISVSYEGGFAPPGTIFARSPLALVTGDDRVLTTGPVIAIYPGPLLPNILQRSITPAAVQQLVAKADELGLLADVTYARNDLIADAPDTVVDITVGGRTYHHQAYALGIDEETDPARQHLLEFVNAMTDLEGTVGAAALGTDEPYQPADYLIQATPTDPATLDVDIEPTIVPWPQDAPVRLADAAECAVLPADVAGPLFADATTLTFFTDAGVTYAVAAVQQVPGRTC
jgi:hypothetical protein